MNRATVIALATIAGLLIGVGAAVAVQLYYPSTQPDGDQNHDGHMEPLVKIGDVTYVTKIGNNPNT